MPTPEDPCIEWLGRKDRDGYGVDPWEWRAHRMAWFIFNGPIPPGMCVCHSCDNRACINVNHLWVGSQLENARDMYAKGRNVNRNALKTHCVAGHEFTEANTYIAPGGWRQCRTCARRRVAEYNARKRAADAA